MCESLNAKNRIITDINGLRGIQSKYVCISYWKHNLNSHLVIINLFAKNKQEKMRR